MPPGTSTIKQRPRAGMWAGILAVQGSERQELQEGKERGWQGGHGEEAQTPHRWLQPHFAPGSSKPPPSPTPSSAAQNS